MSEKTYSAGGIVLNNKNQILVVNQNNDSWSLPKGHIDQGEDALKAAVREIEEESGIMQETLELIKEMGSYERYLIGLDGNDDTTELKNITIFLFKTEQRELAPIDPANPEARWVNIDEVADLLTHRRDKEFFRSVIDELIKY